MGPRRYRALIAWVCAFVTVAGVQSVSTGAQERPAPATTQPPPAGSPSTSTVPASSTTTLPGGGPEQAPVPGEPSDPGDGFTIPEAPQREAPPEDAPLAGRPSRASLVPPPIDLDSLNAVVQSRRAEATAGARLLADQANAAALRVAGSRKAELDALLVQVPAVEARVEAARGAERTAVADLEKARDNLSDIAAEAYTIAAIGGGADARASMDVIEGIDGFENLLKTSQYSGAAWKSLRATVGEREELLAEAEAETAASISALASLEGEVAVARGRLDQASADAQQTFRDGEELVVLAGQIGDDLGVDGLGPTILGETLLGPEDMATFSALRPNAPPYERLLELAEFFVAEGESEGVRGDIAWAQSILETGNFGYRGSMVSTSDNNYAGIGACDSCSSGFRYDSPQLGVRAQMQLLRAYADDNLTSAQLGNPPVGRPPERVGVRGCCDTWMELSGVWATGPGYGVKILTLYNEMLAHAAARQAAGVR